MSEAMNLKELQHCELEILIMFDEYCRNHDLHYVMYYGTLLGAVRHHGFIPWDDDVDIAMPRPDYEKLIRLYYDQEVLFPEPFRLVTGERDQDFALAYGKVLRTDTVIDEESRLYTNDGGCLWMDIFPIDGFPDNWEKTDRMKTLLECNTGIGRATSITGKRRGNESLGKTLARIPVSLYSHMQGYEKYKKRYIQEALKYPYEQCDLVGIATYTDALPTPVMKKADTEDYINLEFEGHQFMAFSAWDEYLKGRYGNYMELPPVEKRTSHYIQVRKREHA